MKRRASRPSDVVVGWTEVWSNSADALSVASVPIKRPSVTARLQDGRYRLVQRKPLALPRQGEQP